MEFGTIKRKTKKNLDEYDSNYPKIRNVDPNYLKYVEKEDAKAKKDQTQYGYGTYDPEQTADSDRRRKKPYTSIRTGVDDIQPLPATKYIPALHSDYYATGSQIKTKPPKNLESVYGTFDNKPIEGPAPWEHFYRDWKSVGSVPQGGAALTLKEIEFLDKYGFSLTRHLGSGGFGQVFQMEWNMFDFQSGTGRTKSLACKVLDISRYVHSFTINPKEAVEKLTHEVNILKDLKHPNIVSFEGMFHIHHPETGFPTIKLLVFMEMCEGDLCDYINTRPEYTLNEDEAREVMKQISRGLKYLHGQNVVHFDIKPDNVLYVTDPATGERVYKLTDFGLAQKFEMKAPRTADAGGTPDYIAPEVEDAVAEFSAKRADIYSLGCTLCAMVIGADWDQFLKMLRNASWPPDRKAIDHYRSFRNLGPEVLDLIRLMTREDPMERPKIRQVLGHKWLKM